MFPTKTEYKRQEVFGTQHRTVCVLGGSGLIGTAVCDLLDTSNEIKKRESHNFNMLEDADIKRLSRLLITTKNPIQIIHLSWFTNPVEYWSSPANYKWTNFTKILINYLLENSSKDVHLVFSGSRAQLYKKDTAYSNSKNELLDFCKSVSGSVSKFSCSWLFVPTVFGGVQKEGNLLFKMFSTVNDDQDIFGFSCDEHKIRISTSNHISRFIFKNFVQTGFPGKFVEYKCLGLEVKISELYALVKAVSKVEKNLQKHLLDSLIAQNRFSSNLEFSDFKNTLQELDIYIKRSGLL